ncbi:uncharacterized protein PV07_12067 [Cladophialophora immunda]|uniref:Amidohydrolase-related domain-containing protein n=1 Tax=Cladophialophora immunda TaxID=569365 RepID=A0A0D2C026_9EURO|nr:uncharacterized protein PV07_12067 [Cladophialophora immunda]KIW23905.1 hypothetical protein PV07_12067 [Cladophialophora immunda]OQU95613.1 hypothetical protein CLAIMM_01795 [Cladophialophora immunda]
MVPPLIALEEHFFSQAVLAGSADSYSEQLKHIPGLIDKLADVGDLRLKSMDVGKVSLQIVSHAPGTMSASQCRSANDQLAEAVKNNPDRFAGFAVLPVSQPAECAAELTRCVKELDFVGALIENHAADGTYFDGSAYLPMFQAAQDLDVPIYLHPTWPTQDLMSLLYTGDNIPRAASISLSSSAFGWHSDVAVHVLRLFAAGLFDRLPRLKIIIGHMGEMLPFMLERIMQLSPRWGTRQRDFKTVWDENIWITTSGDWSVNPMACILKNTKLDHVLYSVDYPFARNEDGLKFMEELEQSGLVSVEQLEMIAHGNAERLLRVKHKKRWD